MIGNLPPLADAAADLSRTPPGAIPPETTGGSSPAPGPQTEEEP